MTRDLLLCLACVLLAAAAPAADRTTDSKPSVLVQVTKLEQGSLPEIVTAYGSVQPNASARMTVMAPLAAVVDDVFVRQGEQLGKGARLVRLVPSPAVAASYARAQSALIVANELVARTRKLATQHLATQQQLTDAEKSASDALGALRALQAQGAGGPTTLRARFAAVVTGISTSPGAIVGEGAALLDLVQPSGLVLKVGVVPGAAAKVMAGDAVRITPIGGGAAATGKVLLRGSVIEPGSGLVPVQVALPLGRFLEGEMAEADITTGQVSGYMVPHEAILVNDHGAPYVVQAVNMKARKVAVTILAADGNRDVVQGPLDAAAPLVLAGNYQLDDGMRVRIADPPQKSKQ
jgi:membrane fusion protein (multidrug efflux system)